MEATYVQSGHILDYTPTDKAVAYGEVVNLKTRIGIALDDIPQNAAGHIQVNGTWRMTKAPSETIEQGAAVYYVTASDHITATQDANIPAGYAVAKAESDAGTVLVKLLG